MELVENRFSWLGVGSSTPKHFWIQNYQSFRLVANQSQRTHLMITHCINFFEERHKENSHRNQSIGTPF